MGDKAEPKTAAEAIEDGPPGVRHARRGLKGKFALIRMKARGKGKPQWLLIKMKDEFAEAGSDGEQRPGAEGQAARQPPKAGTDPCDTTSTDRKEVELTHPDKVIFPEAGLTKARRLRLLREHRRPAAAVPEGPARHARAAARGTGRGRAPLLAEGHARLLPRLDPAHRAGDRAGQDGPLRAGQRRARRCSTS